ncbi:MrcB family domain-containing protein [Massilia aquatica]|uniref:DUF3578 domain-containing protein n=1 Tax=Massilia aquatica TaxID=2609000 RepID=A0ABX0MAC3_9BURK|nr:DUF3578 domain-containing protein [Massilia aquatica]NHZ43269.1 DUF3578 domain-containing protein [Massilia aquatica]
MQLLLDVFDNYLDTRSQLSGKAKKIGTADQISILNDLPGFFTLLLTDCGRISDFEVMGSIGTGNIARVPWIAIFNSKVTTTAQDGYYIVLLFSEAMDCCYLSLNQGVTSVQRNYSRKLAVEKIQVGARKALLYLNPEPRSILGRINLKATGDLGIGYENGAIISYHYPRTNLPSKSQLKEDLFALLHHYDRLLPVAGSSIQNLVPVSEAEFQQVALEKAATKLDNTDVTQIDFLKAVPVPKRVSTNRNGWARSVSVSAYALRQAEFMCEVDPMHQTFISNSGKRPYVEAHHLVPMSHQGEFKWSLDVPSNVVALCALCHKLLHHGRALDKKEYLMKLFENRKNRLLKNEISLDFSSLYGFYAKDSVGDD